VSDDSPLAPPDGPAEDFAGSPAQFAELARAFSSEPTVQATLQRIVDVAVATIDGCDGAGVLLVHRREIVVGAWSDDLVRRVEQMEYELNEGPCLDAIWQHPVFESADLSDHIARWPKFAPHALDAGIRSMLGLRLFAAEDTIGSLDLYGYEGSAFDETSRAVAIVLAAHAAMALAGAQLHEKDLDDVASLREALVARDVIGQAKGILMATRNVDADGAFGLLVRASQSQNTKLRKLAEEVARTRQLPEQASSG
jgi:transcriptional regulator with GAF, ATPase, and Fis domain